MNRRGMLLMIVGALLSWSFTDGGFNRVTDLQIQNYAAQQLIAGAGLTTPPDGLLCDSLCTTLMGGAEQPLTVWPPLLSLILAGLHQTFGPDAMPAYRLFNALVYGAIAFYTYRLARGRMLPTLATLMAPPMVLVTVYAISEPVFILLVLAWLDQVGRIKQTWGLIGLATVAAAATMQRYVGVILIPLGILAIGWRPSRWVTYTAIASYPLAMWATRNYYLTGTLFGPRPSANNTLEALATELQSTFLEWSPYVFVFVLIFAGGNLWRRVKRA